MYEKYVPEYRVTWKEIEKLRFFAAVRVAAASGSSALSTAVSPSV